MLNLSVLCITAFKKLKEQLTCSICLGTYTDPMQLECNHVYCYQCLLGLVQQGQQGLTCPTCRHITPVPVNGVAYLQSDFRTNQLLDVVAEDWMEGAVAQPDKVENASTIHTPHATPTIDCPEHAKEVELYCDTCEESICWKCVIKGGKHINHDYAELDKVFERLKGEILSSLGASEKALAQLNVDCGEISNQQAAIEKKLHKRILRKKLKTQLISESHQAQIKLKSLAAERDQIETTQVQLKKHLQYLMETGNKGEILHLMKMSTIKQLTCTIMGNQATSATGNVHSHDSGGGPPGCDGTLTFVGLFDYDARTPEDLSFRKGTCFKI